jgi:hypothetical protein
MLAAAGPGGECRPGLASDVERLGRFHALAPPPLSPPVAPATSEPGHKNALLPEKNW